MNSGQFSSVSRHDCCSFPTLSPCCSPGDIKQQLQWNRRCCTNSVIHTELNCWLWTEGLKCNSMPYSLLLLQTWGALNKTDNCSRSDIAAANLLPMACPGGFFNLPRILITLFLLCPSHIPYFHFRFWGKNVKTSVWNVAPRVQNSLSLQK